ncbi:MAG TPA: HDIG domain-containing protein, partial [Patescibacteria group bacterium]|nr:HDIG domain-containing protein [Patescibacteria group bacterium]
MDKIGISKQQADELVEKYISNPITKLHLIESEEIMKALARKFGEDEEKWGIIGLLHDIDWDLSKDNTMEHCAKMVPILKEAGATDFLIETIQSHGYGNPQCGAPQDKIRSTKLEYCLAAAETLT